MVDSDLRLLLVDEVEDVARVEIRLRVAALGRGGGGGGLGLLLPSVLCAGMMGLSWSGWRVEVTVFGCSKSSSGSRYTLYL